MEETQADCLVLHVQRHKIRVITVSGKQSAKPPIQYKQCS